MSDTGDGRPAEQSEPGRSFVDTLRSVLGLRRESNLRAAVEDALAQPAAADPEPDADAFTADERTMLRNILGLRTVRVDDVAVPRADIVAVEENVRLGDLLTVLREAAHSRLPVYRGTLDEPLGMVHLRDVLGLLAIAVPEAPGSAAFDLARIDLSTTLAAAGITREVLYVPPSMPVLDLLVQMRATRIQLALVIDEYGGTDGIVSIEDLIEQVVGEIEDEHDVDEHEIAAAGDGWIANARASLDEVRAALGSTLPFAVPAELEDEVATLGGLVVLLAGRLPVRGDVVRGPGEVVFEVLDADRRRVKRLRIRRADAGPPSAPTAAA